MLISKPGSDNWQYRYVVLGNGLGCLLASDPQQVLSAASLAVHVGSFAEPREAPGLAHFLEHMLFMGTGKYPEVNGYSEFITSHGGQTNAYTCNDVTSFSFDIASEYFAPALDRFSQFFKEPLLLEGSI
jgi:insulysin